MPNSTHLKDDTLLKQMKDAELLSAARARVNEEKNATLAVLYCLREIERRRLHLARGFQSLHDFATRDLGYSPAAAQRRIQAMRLLREIPEVETKIEQGLISLDTAARAQGFFKQEEKSLGNLPLERKKEILSQLEGKSSRQCERVLASLSSHPEAFLRPDSIKAVGASSVEVRFVAEEKLLQDLNRLREIFSHKNPSMSLAELIAEMARIALAEFEPKKSRKRRSMHESPGQNGSGESEERERPAIAPLPQPPQLPGTSQLPEPHYARDSAPAHPVLAKPPATPAPDSDSRPEQRPAARSRYIPAAIRREVFARDGYRCAYVDPLTGRRCGSRFQLELDHWRVPFTKGGEHSAHNLQTLCKRHNLWLAIQTYGASKISRFQHGRTSSVPSTTPQFTLDRKRRGQEA